MSIPSPQAAVSPLPAPRFGAARARLRGTPIHLAWRSLRGRRFARRYTAELAGVRTHCLFIGHARSGHSIVGALLDAHPGAIVSDELDALRYVSAGFDRGQVMGLSIAVSRDGADRQRRKNGRNGGTYSYFVPGQWQGRWSRLDVVGDSDAGRSVQRLDAEPELLERVQSLMSPAEVRFVHVVRNPFDNISTMMIRGGRTFDGAFERYFSNCAALDRLRPRIGADHLFTLRHEDLLADPRWHLAEAGRFLGLESDGDHLEACASILYRSPAMSREAIAWAGPMKDRVRQAIEEYGFLAGYRYDHDQDERGSVSTARSPSATPA